MLLAPSITCIVKEVGDPELLGLFNDRFVDAECLLIKAEGKGDFDFVIRLAHPVTIGT